ncbi:MAG TPA: hypothetical protein VF079_10290 [Sphingomicrobium sp.]
MPREAARFVAAAAAMRLFWLIVMALVSPYVAWEMARQLYRAAMDGYILTGRSMRTRVYREKNPALFRNNVVANILLFPVIAGGACLFILEALQSLRLID